MAPGSTRGGASLPRRSRGHGLFPPQHGAWAFLALPVVLGAAATGWSWLLVPLTVAWVAAYPLSWAVTGLLTARRPQRFRRPALVWLGLALPPAVLLVALRPWLVWVGLAYAGLFAVNLRYARARDERALANDLVLILECTLMVPLVVALVRGGRGWLPDLDPVADARVAVLAALCALTLAASTLHVKSLIRERRNERFLRASRTYAVACIPLVAATAYVLDDPGDVLLAVPFALLAVRTFVMPGRSWRPARIGMVELAAFVLVAATAVAVVPG